MIRFFNAISPTKIFAEQGEIITSKFITLTNLSEFLTKCKTIFPLKDSLANVATSGSYEDLLNKPNIPESAVVDTALSSTSTNAVQNKAIYTAVSAKADKATTLLGYGITDAKIANGVITLGGNTITPITSHQSLSAYAKLTDLAPYAKSADLATVATSGSYNDLKNKPTIPDEYVLPTATASTLGGIKIGSDLTISSGVVNVSHATKADSATKATQDGAGNVIVDTYATKDDIAAFAKALKYKGSVATYSALPTSAEIGDVYNVQAADKTHGVKAGENVVWNGTAWDNLGGTCDMSEYTKTEDLATVATSGSYNDLKNKPTIPSEYTLPTASSSVLGGVKIGSDLSITSAGVLSVSHATKADSATTATSATKATQDGNGSVISTTYVKTANLQEATTAEIEALFN